MFDEDQYDTEPQYDEYGGSDPNSFMEEIEGQDAWQV